MFPHKINMGLRIVILVLLSTSFKTSCSLEESQDLSSRESKDDLISVRNGEKECNLDTLQLVQVVFRHGDRSPIKIYPADPYNKDFDIYWPLGKGELTQKGVDQHYALGSYFRKRYDGFLSPQFSPKEVYVLSSDMDRTLMSAEANKVGLFPKVSENLITNATRLKGGLNMNSEIPVGFNQIGIQLVPIHTMPKDIDNLIRQEAPCARKDEALHELYTQDPAYLKLVSDNYDLIKFVEKTMELPNKTNIFDTLEYVDVLVCQKAHNMTIPDWANDTVMEQIDKIRGIGFAMKSSTTELQRLTGGPLTDRIVKNMLNYTVQIKAKPFNSVGEKGFPKMFVYSGHDSTLAAVMSTFGIFDPQMPPYASTFIVELHRRPGDGEYYVEFFYRNSTEEKLLSLQIPGCEVSCPLSKLVSVLKPVFPINWHEECQSKSSLLQQSLGSSQSYSIIDSGSYPYLKSFSVFHVIFLGLFVVGIMAVSLAIYLGDGSAKSPKRNSYFSNNIKNKNAYIQIS